MISIENQAAELIKTFDLSFPINPREVCNAISTTQFKIEYQECSLENKDLCGISVGNTSGAQILVNLNNKNFGRRLFTAAHEIGHVLLHIQSGKYLNPHCLNEEVFNISKSIIEKEANQFASALLLPKHLLQADIDRNDLTWDLIKKITIKFKTSFEATARRIINLSKEPCALLIHQNNQFVTSTQSKKFSFYVGKSTFPKYLETTIIYDKYNQFPNQLINCEPSDWGIELKKSEYKCRYSSINFHQYHKIMTLISIEEIDRYEHNNW